MTNYLKINAIGALPEAENRKQLLEFAEDWIIMAGWSQFHDRGFSFGTPFAGDGPWRWIKPAKDGLENQGFAKVPPMGVFVDLSEVASQIIGQRMAVELRALECDDATAKQRATAVEIRTVLRIGMLSPDGDRRLYPRPSDIAKAMVENGVWKLGEGELPSDIVNPHRLERKARRHWERCVEAVAKGVPALSNFYPD